MTRRACWRALLPACLLAGAARATLIPQISFEILTDSSELIVSGRIDRSWTAWDSAGKYIWTHYEMSVSSALKGAPGSIVEFAEPGGEIAGQVMAIGGAVRYASGDQVLVFLSRMPNRYLRTTGWAQGKYSLDQAGRLRASAAIGGEIAGNSDRSALSTLDGMSLRELGDRVAARVRVAAAGRRP